MREDWFPIAIIAIFAATFAIFAATFAISQLVGDKQAPSPTGRGKPQTHQTKTPTPPPGESHTEKHRKPEQRIRPNRNADSFGETQPREHNPKIVRIARRFAEAVLHLEIFKETSQHRKWLKQTASRQLYNQLTSDHAQAHPWLGIPTRVKIQAVRVYKDTTRRWHAFVQYKHNKTRQADWEKYNLTQKPNDGIRIREIENQN